MPVDCQAWGNKDCMVDGLFDQREFELKLKGVWQSYNLIMTLLHVFVIIIMSASIVDKYENPNQVILMWLTANWDTNMKSLKGFTSNN